MSTTQDHGARAVLDTQVVLDWLLFDDPRVAPLAQAIRARRLVWVATAAMRDELQHMLGHRSLARWPADRAAALGCFDELARLQPPPPPLPVLRCRDPDDQIFVDLAVAAGARWLFTRDKALLALARRAARLGTAIVAPAGWPPAHAPGAGK